MGEWRENLKKNCGSIDVGSCQVNGCGRLAHRCYRCRKYLCEHHGGEVWDYTPEAPLVDLMS